MYVNINFTIYFLFKLVSGNKDTRLIRLLFKLKFNDYSGGIILW